MKHSNLQYIVGIIVLFAVYKLYTGEKKEKYCGACGSSSIAYA